MPSTGNFCLRAMRCLVIAGLLGVALCMRGAPSASAAAPEGAVFTLATPEEGAAVLRTPDAYLNAVSPADLSIWLRRSDDGATAADLGEHLAANARAWNATERARLDAMLTRISPRLRPLEAWLPPRILIAAVTREAAQDADFTRGATIFLAGLQPTEAALDERFFHEVFHLLSRHNPDRRDDLYAVIGFAPCRPMALPGALRARLLTNPDAPDIEHAAPISAEDPTLLTTPLLLASPPRYDTSRPAFFDYLRLRFIPLRRDASGGCAPTADVTLTQAQLFDAVAQGAGRNTQYALHPEEILADNFAQMMMGRRDAPNPEVYDRLSAVLGLAR